MFHVNRLMILMKCQVPSFQNFGEDEIKQWKMRMRLIL